MESTIHDQLDESQANKHLRSTAFEMSLFGTGIIKAICTKQRIPNWNEDGEYDPLFRTIPKVESVVSGIFIQIQTPEIWLRLNTLKDTG